MDIYGERGSCEHNLRRYMHSTEWALDCRIVENVQQIPTLNIDQIKQQIQWESAMQKKSSYNAEICTILFRKTHR